MSRPRPKPTEKQTPLILSQDFLDHKDTDLTSNWPRGPFEKNVMWRPNDLENCIEATFALERGAF